MTRGELKRYERYKDSGVEWLGEVPEEWEVTRNKDLFMERGKLSATGEETLLTVSHITGVTRRTEKEVNMFMAETMEGYKLCERGDLVINTMWAWMGALGTCNEGGICSPAYGVYRPQKNRDYNYRYFDYLYRTPNAITEMTRNSKGIVSSRLRLYPKDFFQIKTALPSISEQNAIAAYLDKKANQFDRKIELLTAKADRYRELKQALINETVTRGLDPTVPLKDSGVEWIGEVPAHWEVTRHKDNFKLISGKCEKFYLAKVGLENIESKTGKYIVTVSDFDGDGVEFMKNDILFGKLRPYLAKVYLSDFNGSAVGDIFVYRLLKKILPIFAKYLMLSDRYIDVINSSTAGAKMPRVNSGFIANLIVCIPPLHEQQAIATYLDTKTTQIQTLQELRKTLINDVVTGKIKVV